MPSSSDPQPHLYTAVGARRARRGRRIHTGNLFDAAQLALVSVIWLVAPNFDLENRSNFGPARERPKDQSLKQNS